MRTFLNGQGSDVTATVAAYLKARNQAFLADLYLIGELDDPMAVRLTDWPSPLLWPVCGTFLPSVTTRGMITSEVGLQVDSLNFSWSPPRTAPGTSIGTANAYQKARSGFFDSKTFRLWRAVMPTPGDANTYGACILFGGRVQDTTVERGKIAFSINSFLDVVNQTVPPNVIEWSNTLANYMGNTPVVSDNETDLPQFTVVAPSSAGVINAVCNSPSVNKIYGNNKFRFGFIAFNAGSALAGYYATVASNYRVTLGGVHYNQFTLYQQFPWPPEVGDTFYASIQPPLNQQDAVAAAPYDGFRWVPQPEGAA